MLQAGLEDGSGECGEGKSEVFVVALYFVRGSM